MSARQESRRQWALVALGVHEDARNVELRSWLRSVASAILNADELPDANLRRLLTVEALGLSGPLGVDADGLQFALLSFETYAERDPKFARFVDPVAFVADAMGWPADDATPDAHKKRIRRALSHLGPDARRKFDAILKHEK